MMTFILATDFDFIAYMSKMAFLKKLFFTPMAFLEYDIHHQPILTCLWGLIPRSCCHKLDLISVGL